MLDRATDRLRRGGAPVMNLALSRVPHAGVGSVPSDPGIENAISVRQSESLRGMAFRTQQLIKSQN